jgi:hypothetical protein
MLPAYSTSLVGLFVILSSAGTGCFQAGKTHWMWSGGGVNYSGRERALAGPEYAGVEALGALGQGATNKPMEVAHVNHFKCQQQPHS